MPKSSLPACLSYSMITGAVIGMSATVASSVTPPKFLPSFGWFTGAGLTQGDPGRLLDAATQMMIRRGVDMTDEEIELFLELETHAQDYDDR